MSRELAETNSPDNNVQWPFQQYNSMPHVEYLVRGKQATVPYPNFTNDLNVSIDTNLLEHVSLSTSAFTASNAGIAEKIREAHEALHFPMLLRLEFPSTQSQSNFLVSGIHRVDCLQPDQLQQLHICIFTILHSKYPPWTSFQFLLLLSIFDHTLEWFLVLDLQSLHMHSTDHSLWIVLEVDEKSGVHTSPRPWTVAHKVETSSGHLAIHQTTPCHKRVFLVATHVLDRLSPSGEFSTQCSAISAEVDRWHVTKKFVDSRNVPLQ